MAGAFYSGFNMCDLDSANVVVLRFLYKMAAAAVQPVSDKRITLVSMWR